jgi:hypothetical protein
MKDRTRDFVTDWPNSYVILANSSNGINPRSFAMKVDGGRPVEVEEVPPREAHLNRIKVLTMT